MENNQKGIAKFVGTVLVVFIAIIVFFTVYSYDRIDAANEGIKVNLTGNDRGAEDAAVVTGWVFYNDWTTEIKQIPLNERSLDYQPFSVTTKDNSVFTVDPTIRYAMIKGNGPKVYVRFRQTLEQLEASIFYEVMRKSIREVTNSMTSDSLMSNRAVYEDAIYLQASTEFTKLGFNLMSFTSGVTPPQSLTKAIEDKNIAIQDAIKFSNQAKAEEKKAEIAIAQAKGAAEAEVARAKGRYDAAVYDAKATKEKAQALTPLIVEMEKIKKWNGSVPYMLGTGSTPIIDLRK